jgi:hypothetical protein
VGGINFGWLAVGGVSPDWLKPKGYVTIIRRLGEAAAPMEGGGGAGRAPSLHLYPGICLTTEENYGKPQSGYFITKGVLFCHANSTNPYSDLTNSCDFLNYRRKHVKGSYELIEGYCQE